MVSLAVVLVAGGTLLVLKPWSHASASPSASVPSGYTNEVTVPTQDPAQAHPAQPKPSTLPPKIYAEGKCKDALDKLRAIFDKYPSGLTLDQKGMDELNAALPALSSDCDSDTASKFQAQELSPWLNYATN